MRDRDWRRRRETRGAELYDAAYAWRSKRAKGGFTEFCRIVDAWIADDRERTRRMKRARKENRAMTRPAPGEAP